MIHWIDKASFTLTYCITLSLTFLNLLITKYLLGEIIGKTN